MSGFLGTVADICKLNYIIGLRRVQLYQPIDIPEKYRKFILPQYDSFRGSRERYEYVTETLLQNTNYGVHLDVGTNFGFIPLSLGSRGLFSIGLEIQYFSCQIANCLARLNKNNMAIFINTDVTEIVNRVPVVESISMLSVLHHIVAGYEDVNTGVDFLRTLFSKAQRRIVLEVADPGEGEYSWREKNRNLHGGRSALDWYSTFLGEQGFSVSRDVRYFDTHLGVSRPIIVADRIG
jgi:hypothetical protein